MTLNSELKQYLAKNFPGLQLTQPLFYKKIPGLRFDLQDEKLEAGSNNNLQEYLAEVNRRINIIYNEVINANDDILIFYNCYTWKRRKIRKSNYIIKQLLNPLPPHQFKRTNTPPNNDKYFKGDRSCQLIIKDKASNINFKNIFKAISHTDFYFRPVIEGEVYIINETTNIIILMYDDRGCDVISNDIPILRSYYNKLSDLVLEYDREQIIKTLSLDNVNPPH
ncbi:DUF3885 domain-containing protein [Mucilaginibacter polytrichastri]|uniref:DUF3885 domain-containing protein n=1 Tax=Mucilaginibacter polytrichastri TaxID=1302689 RepID=A0A1Q5ZYD2_9SPHI|nr:DUF3885 domain-containing protein [Mucilaginibacter polytrichastri]OKS86766.1 hypothetical protein RG47T_2223 [Mucilaginibacter polytrichastri]SFT22513.1 protein of unknown function [Mucilaginibacter polytrichastri]